MTRHASPRLGAYAGLAALALLAALVLGRPELVALGAPFALLLAVGLALARHPVITVRVVVDRERALEGDHVTVDVTLEATDAVERLEVLLALPPGLETAREDNPVAVQLAAGEEQALSFDLTCERWGAFHVGHVVVRARDAVGLFFYEAVSERTSPLRVYPRPERLQGVLRPYETQVFAGNQVARATGDGIEFADIRPFAPGDRVRRVNWRASARRGDLVVNELHPERNTDVVLFLDSFSEARGESEGTLDLTVRAAAALAEKYLARKDRVGVIGFGGVLRWLLPASGVVQLYRILDSLLDTEVVLNYAWRDIDVIPPRTLPPKAPVVALTPLLDERAVNALLDLRARGFDLAIVEVSPVAFAPAGADEAELLAHWLWRMRRDALRGRFERAGVAVAEWHADDSLAETVEEVGAFRRHARHLHA